MAPGARDGHALAEGGLGGVVVLFGGWDGGSYSAETWAFGGGDYPLPLFADGIESGGTDGWSAASP